MANVLDIAKKLNREYGSDSFIRQSNVIPNYKRLKSRAFGMMYPLFGGLPYGRIIQFSGKQHSGKTTGAFVAIADFQRENPDKTCIFVDVEHSLDLQFQVAMHGINQKKLWVMEPDVGMSGEQILSAILDLQLGSDDIGLIAIDSVAALDTAQNLKTDFEKDNGKRASIAGPLHKFCKEIMASLREKQNILLFINQVRIKDTIANGIPIYTEPGGDAPRFYSSVSVRFGTRKFMKESTEMSGDDGTGADGFKIKFSITKNKTANVSRGGGFITYRYISGMDWLYDLLEIATGFGFIERLNTSQYRLIDLSKGTPYVDENGKELKGTRNALINYILNNKPFQDKYVEMLQNYISSSNTDNNILDEETSKEIALEESTVQVEE